MSHTGQSNTSVWFDVARSLEPTSGAFRLFINALWDDIIALNPQGRSAAPAASHQPVRRRDAKGIFIHLSVSLFTCVAVATLIAIETAPEGLKRREWVSSMSSRLNKEKDVCIFIIVLLVVKGVPLVLRWFKGSWRNSMDPSILQSFQCYLNKWSLKGSRVPWMGTNGLFFYRF